MIVARHLTRVFGSVTAVDGIDFEIPRGSVVGFLGPNGAGKTTTIRMIAGVLPPTAGTVTVDGLDATGDDPAVRRRIGYLPESSPLYPEMRVRAYLAFRAALFDVPRAKRRAAIDAALDRCGLGSVRDRAIGQLSKGFRQRVGLAAALLHEPPVLVLDEPTEGLDPNQIAEVRGLIGRLAGERTVLLSTHILAEVERICDRVLLIAGGRIRAAGTIEALRRGGDERVIVEARGEAATSALRSAGARAVDAEPMGDGWMRCTVTPPDGAADWRASIAAALGAAGVPMRELRREATSLEQRFAEIVAGSAGEGGDA